MMMFFLPQNLVESINKFLTAEYPGRWVGGWAPSQDSLTRILASLASNTLCRERKGLVTRMQELKIAVRYM